MRSEVIKLNYYGGLGCNETVCFPWKCPEWVKRRNTWTWAWWKVCFLRLYLSKAGLAVSNGSPIFAVHAVGQFVLPDECSVLSTRAALQPSCTLGNDATHHLRYTQVHLQHSGTQALLLACSLHQRKLSIFSPLVYQSSADVLRTINTGVTMQNKFSYGTWFFSFLMLKRAGWTAASADSFSICRAHRAGRVRVPGATLLQPRAVSG